MKKRTIIMIVVVVSLIIVGGIVLGIMLHLGSTSQEVVIPERDRKMLANVTVDENVKLVCTKETITDQQLSISVEDVCFYLYDDKDLLKFNAYSERSYAVRYDDEQITGMDIAEIPEMRSDLLDFSGKTYAVIIIAPYRKKPVEWPPEEVYNPPYEQTVFYGLIPQDTMQTKPIKIQREDVFDGYPMWVFVIDTAEMTDNYRVVYGDFYLSGSQILGT